MTLRRKYAAFLLVLSMTSPQALAERRRGVRAPAISDVTPAGWLINHAYPLNDMQPLRSVIGAGTEGGWGDGA